VNERILPLFFEEISSRKGDLHAELELAFRSFVRFPSIDAGGGGEEAMLEMAFTVKNPREISDVCNFPLVNFKIMH
jgi:hypothetical protein